MGLLDNNLITALAGKKSGTLYSGTGSVTIASADSNIDCRKHNQLLVGVNTTGNVEVSFTPKSDSVTTRRVLSKILYLNNGSIVSNAVNSVFPTMSVGNGQVHYFLVDVSQYDIYGIGLSNPNGANVIINYTLSTDNHADEKINAKELGDIIKAPRIETGTFNPRAAISSQNNPTKGYSTVILKVVVNDDAPYFGFYCNLKKLYCVELDCYIPRPIDAKISTGTYTFIGDCSAINKFYFQGVGTSGSTFKDDAVEYILTNVTLDEKKPKHAAYKLHVTGSVGERTWSKVPYWAKYCVVNVINTGNTSSRVPIFTGEPTPYNSSAPVNYDNISPSYQNGVLNIVTGKTISNGGVVSNSEELWLVDCKGKGYISTTISADTSIDISIFFTFYEEEIPAAYKNILYPVASVPVDVNIVDYVESAIKAAGFVKTWGTDAVDVYEHRGGAVPKAVLDSTWVWYDSTNKIIYVSTDGINGERSSVIFNSNNFPNLLADSDIAHIILLPYTRNPTTSYGGRGIRMNVITNRGQVYHNYPSRSSNTNSEGNSQDGDILRFDESVIWELPERWTPVATNTGSDAELIATGKYRYFPGLPNQCYEMHPAINQNNGYGNNGFGATLTKGNLTFGRFWNIDNTNAQCNAMSFMGGYAWHEKMCMIGTYRSNTSKDACSRICVFVTNDGGRQWFCRYEFGEVGRRYSMDSDGNVSAILDYGSGIYRHDFSFSGTNVDSNVFSMKVRGQIVPSVNNKEPDKKFTYLEPVAVSAIGTDSNGIKITTTTAHGLKGTDIVCFTKSGITATDYDWIANNDCNETSAGNGVFFVAEIVDTTSFYIHPAVHNPHNELTVRHIHSVDRCKDGYTISSGERYPNGGWIIWMPCKEGDTFDDKFPWTENLGFVRLNSTSTSIYRTLGTFLQNDVDNSIICGIDDSMIDMGDIDMPAGRTDSIKRGSQGVWLGKLVDIDELSKYDNVLPSDDVAYGFKVINGICYYIGQTKTIAVSFDMGKTWVKGEISRNYHSEHCHFNGASIERMILVDRLLIKVKR